jgi:hypothetical protein
MNLYILKTLSLLQNKFIPVFELYLKFVELIRNMRIHIIYNIFDKKTRYKIVRSFKFSREFYFFIIQIQITNTHI